MAQSQVTSSESPRNPSLFEKARKKAYCVISSASDRSPARVIA